jgi:hypothetical protein
MYKFAIRCTIWLAGTAQDAIDPQTPKCERYGMGVFYDHAS